MEELNVTLKNIGAKNGLEIALDEDGACALELADGRVMILQERADLSELDFVATLGPVPEEARAVVFADLLAANFYWNAESVETTFTRFLELQSAWAERFGEMIASAQNREPDKADEDDEEDEDVVKDDLIINP